MKSVAVAIILSCLWIFAAGGNDLRPKGAESDALGGSSTTLVNAFSIYNNQGAAAFMERPAFGLSYQTSYFPANISDLALTASGPVGFGTLGGSVEYFGNHLYYELKAGLAYSMKLGEKIGFGVQLDYLHSKAQGYDGKHFATFELGLLYEPIDAVSVGVHVFNPVKYKVDESTDEILPIVFSGGLEYRPHSQISVYAEVVKDIDHPFNFTAGLAYQVIDALAVRGGFSTQPAVFSFGLGYSFKDVLIIDASGNYHLDLGFNTSASLSFLLQRKDEGLE